MAAARNGSVAHLQAELQRLRKQVRALQRTCKTLELEREEYFQIACRRFIEDAKKDDWSDFNPADYTSSLEDILTEFEKEHGKCLPRSSRAS